ncbi:Probable methyltransferase TARBP1 [Seminavis robusta]|uniref:Probable methyltransferase TARBP1 n=1 Tax=Seminavis robusta TaxID=568900 RepID=A0A9N8DQI7_9STRA|nr:Probable methyltransferase TARBP1 [Seminavis robusta]|eukprot:Sro212_g088160.1 Probable methyltransferase TARBP1 (383) ;mRNA; f:40208-41678
MILAGNLIVGRYRLDFLAQYEEGATGERVPLNKILAGTIPWLGSTQGFSRGIAQLLTHALIPRVVDVKADSNSSDSDAAGIDSDSLLISIYRFLDENPEMQRLRKKSATFFDSYAVDEVCSPGGILSIPVDEGGEAFPVHMTEIMKQNLQEVYEEAHEKEYPQWKYLEDTMKAKAEEEEEELGESEPVIDDALVNFQRKIIPLDELNLALESMREKRLRNVAGKKKQKLIVCASLIDKVPNLGGLARTAEIFAAEKLVIPDIGVTKMDNFKSFSVAAGDWIEIEECKEENLLMYLRSHRSKGYFIVGLEQTSSSVSLEGFTFPNQPILLLLGKEKEGIPVEFLQAVDQCLEIPQMGITRSLNVHVSGAIAIWEHTKQRLGEI